MKPFTVYKLFLPVFAPKPQSQTNKGVTLIELIAGVVVGAIVIQLAYFGFAINRQLYLNDAAKNNVDQNLKTVFEIVGPTITQAGQGVGTDPRFPVITLSSFPDGSGNSEIILRQVRLGTRLQICRAIESGDQTEIFVLDSDINAPAGCGPISSDGDHFPDNLGSWKNYRLNNGGGVRILVYDGDGQGEFLEYTGETLYDQGGAAIAGEPAENQVAAASLTVKGNLANDYNAGGATQLIVLEERGYRLNGDTLQAIVDGSAVNLMSGIGQFSVTAMVRQGNSVSECSTIITATDTFDCTPGLADPYNWSQIDGVRVTVTPSVSAGDSNAVGVSTANVNTLNNLTQSQTFYPRNLINF